MLGPNIGSTECFASLGRTGTGGPENMTGEKVPVTVRGKPGFRNGKGAEGDYLMWQYRPDAWAEVSCSQDVGQRRLFGLANAVVFRRDSLRLPFAPGPLPHGYAISQLRDETALSSAMVYVGRTRSATDLPDADLAITLQRDDPAAYRPQGRETILNGRPAVIADSPQHPAVCVTEQSRSVCVWAETGDTGPYPDRSSEVPTLLAIATNLRFAPDLNDPTTWFAAEQAFR